MVFSLLSRDKADLIWIPWTCLQPTGWDLALLCPFASEDQSAEAVATWSLCFFLEDDSSTRRHMKPHTCLTCLPMPYPFTRDCPRQVMVKYKVSGSGMYVPPHLVWERRKYLLKNNLSPVGKGCLSWVILKKDGHVVLCLCPWLTRPWAELEQTWGLSLWQLSFATKWIRLSKIWLKRRLICTSGCALVNLCRVDYFC